MTDALPRIRRALHELAVLAVVALLVLASGWIAGWGVRRSGPTFVAIGVAAGLLLVGVRPVRTRLASLESRVNDRIPWENPLLTFALVVFPANLFLTEVDPAQQAHLMAVVGGGFVVGWTWVFLTSLRDLRRRGSSVEPTDAS